MAVISVITPIYNTEKLLGRCVDSILNQTFRDFALILVDDGSTDGSGRLCDELAARDSRIVVLHQKNSGVGAARNRGLDWVFANSDSRWISFVDSDDYIIFNGLDDIFTNISSIHMAYLLRIGIDKYFAGNVILLNL